MQFKPTEEQKFIEEISKDLVTELVPEELDLFDELIQEYFENPNPSASSSDIKDHPLGFGLGETIVAVTPAVTAAVSAVINFVTTELVKSTREETSEMIKKKVRGVFNPVEAEKEGVAPLNEEQLEQVMKLARKQAIQFGMSAKRADIMANALVGRLALSK